MATSTVDKVSDTRVKLTVNVTPDDLKPSIDHAYKHIAEQINIPGFRKGKVPPAIVDQRVGRGEVLNHAVGDAIDTFYRQAVDEQELRILGRAEADVAEPRTSRTSPATSSSPSRSTSVRSSTCPTTARSS